MSTRRAGTIAALLGVALMLAGCATASVDPGIVTEDPGDGPESGQATPQMELEVGAAWIDGGRQIALVTSGSSTCVPSAQDAAVQADGTLAITLTLGDSADACTDDYVPRVTLLAVPEEVDPTQDVALVVTDDQGSRGETDIAGVAGYSADGPTDYAPSAAWVGDDWIALVTWGSSTCVPVVEDVAASDDVSVTVTFATPPADQMCTMDMGPRGTLVDVTGLGVAHADALTLTLTGGDAQFETPVEVAVAG